MWSYVSVPTRLRSSSAHGVDWRTGVDVHHSWSFTHIVKRSRVTDVYNESRKGELKTRPIYECRCDERLKTKSEKSTLLVNTGLIGELEHLKIKTRLIDEMFVGVMGEYVFLKVIGVPSIFKVIRKTSTLVRVLPTFVFRVTENVTQRKWNSPRSCYVS